MYVSIRACIWPPHMPKSYVHTYIHTVHTYMYTYMYMYVYVFVHVHVHICTYVFSLCMLAHICIGMQSCTRTIVRLCVYIYYTPPPSPPSLFSWKCVCVCVCTVVIIFVCYQNSYFGFFLFNGYVYKETRYYKLIIVVITVEVLTCKSCIPIISVAYHSRPVSK